MLRGLGSAFKDMRRNCNPAPAQRGRGAPGRVCVPRRRYRLTGRRGVDVDVRRYLAVAVAGHFGRPNPRDSGNRRLLAEPERSPHNDAYRVSGSQTCETSLANGEVCSARHVYDHDHVTTATSPSG